MCKNRKISILTLSPVNSKHTRIHRRHKARFFEQESHVRPTILKPVTHRWHYRVIDQRIIVLGQNILTDKKNRSWVFLRSWQHTNGRYTGSSMDPSLSKHRKRDRALAFVRAWRYIEIIPIIPPWLVILSPIVTEWNGHVMCSQSTISICVYVFEFAYKKSRFILRENIRVADLNGHDRAHSPIIHALLSGLTLKWPWQGSLTY
jgi:hypothetical protein